MHHNGAFNCKNALKELITGVSEMANEERFKERFL